MRLKDIPRQARTRKEFRFALRYFLQTFALAPSYNKIREAPPDMAFLAGNAYLAGVAETIAVAYGYPIPRWIHEEKRFLKKPYFCGAPDTMKGYLCLNSPIAFKRRHIFVWPDSVLAPLEKDRHAIPI